MKKHERAMQIWMILVNAALERKILTYGHLAKILGYKGSGVFAQQLAPIMDFCENHEMPPLTILVVNQDTGEPGTGLTTIEQLNKDREAVFNFDWFGFQPPQFEDFQ